MATRRICTTCGAEYEYCPYCDEYAHLPKWHFMWDKEECKDLFDAIVSYNVDKTPIQNVKDVLDKYDITDFSKYNTEIRKFLEEHFGNN